MLTRCNKPTVIGNCCHIFAKATAIKSNKYTTLLRKLVDFFALEKDMQHKCNNKL